MPLLLLIFAAMCFFYPEMRGLCIGIGGYCLLWRAIHRAMGGE